MSRAIHHDGEGVTLVLELRRVKRSPLRLRTVIEPERVVDICFEPEAWASHNEDFAVAAIANAGKLTFGCRRGRKCSQENECCDHEARHAAPPPNGGRCRMVLRRPRLFTLRRSAHCVSRQITKQHRQHPGTGWRIVVTLGLSPQKGPKRTLSGRRHQSLCYGYTPLVQVNGTQG